VSTRRRRTRRLATLVAGVTLASVAAGVITWTAWQRDQAFIERARFRIAVEDGGKRWAPPVCVPPLADRYLIYKSWCGDVRSR
jgi:hypothetical protein